VEEASSFSFRRLFDGERRVGWFTQRTNTGRSGPISKQEDFMGKNRRDFFRKAFGGAGWLAGARAFAADPAQQEHTGMTHMHMNVGSEHPSQSPSYTGAFLPVQTPDLPDLTWTIEDGVKVFHLVAEPVKQRIHPDKTLDLWGYNGTSPGPTIQITQGDHVRIVVDNHLPEPTSMHWHGFEIPNAADGAPGTSQAPIPPGGRFVYEFTLHQEGTYFYHSHMAMQEMMGMIGAFVMHPTKPYQPRVDKDFVLILQEYAVLPNNTIPNSMNMEFNWLLLNGKVAPAITPLIVRLGERVRVRMINLGMDHHPIHVHGHTFYVTGTEGGRIPESAWIPGNTVLVGVAQARDVEFIANNPGEWMLHCHLPHHMMNQMSSTVGLMTRLGKGMPAGLSMEEGMGMLTGTPGVPLGEDYGPGLGRGLGVGSTNDQTVGNTPLSCDKAAMGDMQHTMPGMEHGVRMEADVSPDANTVPGFPQDAYMEGPMMAMDEAVWRPENYGLRRGWTGFMQGMMTLVRVLPPDEYDKIRELIRENRQHPIPYTPVTWDIPGDKRHS
jgi:FtsP/CotA-like multicopper oxidase with cupredoxin domain